MFSSRSTTSRAWAWAAAPLGSADDYAAAYQPGHLWSTLLEGEHISSDVARGRRRAAMVAPCRRRSPAAAGPSTAGRSAPKRRPPSSNGAAPGAGDISGATTGMVNLETIGGRIIEAHLRFADQWPDLYGAGWVERCVRLYATGRMAVRRFGATHRLQRRALRPARPRYRHPPADLQRKAAGLPGVSSLRDHLSRKPAARSACHAAGRLSRCHHQLLGSRGRRCCARDAARALRCRPGMSG